MNFDFFFKEDFPTTPSAVYASRLLAVAEGHRQNRPAASRVAGAHHSQDSQDPSMYT